MLQLRNLIASLTIGYFTFRGVTAQLNVRIPLTKDFDNFATETLDIHCWIRLCGIASETLWYTASTTKAQTSPTLAHLINSGKYPALAKGWSTTISIIIHDDFVLQDS
ncbi:hypothetical protein HZ326_25841 [Fusarium oxysporum f. sp. albedinis]|nr:hypothetical protein HZ326_25841 [Fusarium oxysporum f. sp. albedinis]